MKIKQWPTVVFFFVSCITTVATPVFAELHPGNILVVANSFEKKSVSLAKYYIDKRRIPQENLLVIRTTGGEAVERHVYESSIAKPIRKALRKNSSLKCVVLMYGIPLRIDHNKLSFSETHKMRYLQSERAYLEGYANKDVQGDSFKSKLQKVIKEIESIRKPGEQAAVDSELTMVLEDKYPLDGWLPNPMNIGDMGRFSGFLTQEPILVSRLDGPNADTVKRIIKDSLFAEKSGLSGTAFFDARWKQPNKKKLLSGYALYDNSLHRAASLLKKQMPVVLDQDSELFPAGANLPAALYCGWYSLGRYVDSFSWLRGSVGYHIASNECATLKKRGSTVWCKKMLENGVAATIGPVSEPYVQAFPLPELFFGLLTGGEFSLVEAYFKSLPYLSWRMILVGDPLYRPFTKGKNNSINQ